MTETADDAVLNTLVCFTEYSINQGQVPFFIGDSEKLNTFFHKLRKEFPKQIGKIIFDEDRSFLFSMEIESAIFNMATSGLITNWSHNPEVYQTLKPISERIWNISSNEISNYRKIAEPFYNELSCDWDGFLGRHTPLESGLF